jgi:hypothetical protein
MPPEFRFVSLRPGPDDRVLAGSRITITIGISPARHSVDEGNHVEIQVHYRVKDGEERVSAAALKKIEGGIAYYEAQIDPLWAGDRVDYFAVCQLEELPHNETNHSSSTYFMVVDARVKNRGNRAPLSLIVSPSINPSDDPARGLFSEEPNMIKTSNLASSPLDISRGLTMPEARRSSTMPTSSPTSMMNPPQPHVTSSNGGNQSHHIEGRIFLEYGPPAANITLRLYHRGFGGAETSLGEVKTDDNGAYSLAYNTRGKSANIEVRAVDAEGKEISLSTTKYSADNQEVMNLIAPANIRPVAPEFERLFGDLQEQLGGLEKLAGAKENSNYGDLSILHQSTGWDARLIALAASASKLNLETGLSQDVLYPLVRVGLPSDKQLLSQVSAEAIEIALHRAKEAGIVGLDEQQIARAKSDFENFARMTRRAEKTPGSLSSFDEMLNKSGMSDGEQKMFAALYLDHQGTTEELWQKAQDYKLPTDKLRLQGKLAYLTRNNAELTQMLQEEIGSPDNLAQLVENELYRAETWKTRLESMVTNERPISKIIPPTYEGDLDTYAGDLARKVRMSFPSLVVGQMIYTGDLDFGSLKTPVHTFIKNAVGLGFELGQGGLDKFIEDNKDFIFRSIEPGYVEDTTEAIKKLQRLYQITPSNEALVVLYDKGFDSADDVVAYPLEDFLGFYGSEFPSEEEAYQVYHKAQQVQAFVYSFFAAAAELNTTPAEFYSISALGSEREAARNELLKHYPTMETLFGSLDFCECEHCRSVLGPAAYFVDLLQFLEPKDSVWGNYLKKWKKEHDNTISYPFKSKEEAEGFHSEWKKKYSNAPFPFKSIGEWNDFRADWKSRHPGEADPDPELRLKPYDILTEHRPDLPHLRLTCENTNTAMPYIDLVNEILEYYVAHDKLDNGTVQDTGVATTAELLAEPQHTIPEAYNRLLNSRYPLGLPFDLWLETARRFVEYFNAPLWHLLKVFCPTSELFGLPPRSAIGTPTNTTNASVTVPDTDAVKFKVGNVVTYYDLSASAIHNETQTVEAVGASGSGGMGKTLITLSGVWTTPPTPNDFLMVSGYYNWANIFAEYLGISPTEYDIFTDSNPMVQWYELYGYQTNAKQDDILTELKSAKTLSRRLGVSYKEITDIIQTSFVNPGLDKLSLLWRLQLAVGDVVQYFSHKGEPEYAERQKEFEDRLKALDKEYQTLRLDSAAELKSLWEEGVFNQTLLLRDRSTLCSFDQTKLEFAAGTHQDDEYKLVLIKINLFVRLRNKLGMSIEEIDRALQVFLPKDSMPLTATNLGAALATALVYLAHLKSLGEMIKIGKNSRMKLLTFWSDLPTTGRDSFYTKLFLTRSVLKIDPVFDDPLGKYLQYFDSIAGQYKPFQWNPSKPEDVTSGNVSLKNHLVAIQAALNLTANDVNLILQDAKKALNTEPLILSTISQLYRYGLLAKSLKLSVSDLITLKSLSGFDPFKPLEDTTINSLSQDHPFEQTIRFIEVVEKVKDSGFKIEDLDYLLRHRFDSVGKYRSDPNTLLALVKGLAAEIRRIRAEHAVITDDVMWRRLVLMLPSDAKSADIVMLVRKLAGQYPIADEVIRDGLNTLLSSSSSNDLMQLVQTLITELHTEYIAISDDVMRQKLSLVLPADVVEMFFGFWNDTIEFSAQKEQVDVGKKLDPITYEVDGIRVSYDATRKWQRVIHSGVLTDAKKVNILTKVPTPSSTASQDQKQAYTNYVELLDKISENSKPQPKLFFDKYFEGFLVYDDLYGVAAAKLSIQAKRHKVLAAFLPFLQKTLVRQLVVQALTNSLNSDASLIEALLTNAALLADPNRSISLTAQPKRALLEAFTVAAQTGITAQFFNSSGSPLEPAKTVDTTDMTKAPPGTDSARFRGYFEVPAAGAYRFIMTFGKQDAEAELRITTLTEWVMRYSANKDKDENSDFVELKPGILYEFILQARNLQADSFELSVKQETTPKDRLSQLTLYPSETVNAVRRAHVLLAKALQLIKDLGLSERELRYLLTHSADFSQLDLSQLPTEEENDGTLLFEQFLRLVDYVGLRADIAGGNDDLISIFENARNTYPVSADARQSEINLFKSICHRLAELTRRNPVIVQATASSLSFAAQSHSTTSALEVKATDFVHEKGIKRLWEALQVVEKLGVPTELIVSWTKVVSYMVTPAERAMLARDLRSTIKARYEPEDWQRIAQPIFDGLRKCQRDALVAHIIHNHPEIENVNQLFEYFLIDPAMEPVVQTSRLRLAISSIQLFIQRCLLNLEPKVRPSVINAEQWQWMKRYRVWEANRKIFLFPENWLEPEFRDDKTHLFQDLESALLQGDVSNDLVENAFFTYLKKLEELGRLDIVTMYAEEKPNPANNILHVIGRTFALPHKYFYRRYFSGEWTPWEPVDVEIEGDHVVAVMWQQRLHLFWVTFLEKADEDANKDVKIQDMANKTVNNAKPQRKLEIQLNWSEYFQGQWTSRQSGGFDSPIRMDVGSKFESAKVSIYVTVEDNNEGAEPAIKINLSEPTGLDGPTPRTAFRLINKNSPPEIVEREYPESTPYTIYVDSDKLIVHFVQKAGSWTHPEILTKAKNFSLLTSSNWNDIALSASEFKAFVSPFFYQDNQHTFFVEPSLLESKIEEWEEWVITSVSSKPGWRTRDDEHLRRFAELPIEADFPTLGANGSCGPYAYCVDDIARQSRLIPRVVTDLITNPSTYLIFGDEIITRTGRFVDLNGQLGEKLTDQAGEIARAHIGDNLLSDEARGALGRYNESVGDTQTSITVIGNMGVSPVILDKSYEHSHRISSDKRSVTRP